MTGNLHERDLAVLDTSFWTNAHRADVAANCLDLFQIVVPRAVEAEIRRAQTGMPLLTVPSLIVALWARGIISDRAARRKLDLIEATTAKEIMDEARLVLGPSEPHQPVNTNEP